MAIDASTRSESSVSTMENGTCNTTEIKCYKRRFWMLFLFSTTSFLCGVLYTQYVGMADLNCCYYGVSQDAVNWTSMMFMVVYLVGVLPASVIINYIDLRWTVILGALFNTISSTVQLATLKPNGFPFVLVSSFFASLSEVAVLGIPPFIASRWFPSNELSRACAFGVFGNQLGVGIGFILSPLLVSSDCTKKEEIEFGKRNEAILLTAVNAVVLILAITTFQNSPKHPPSLNEMEKKSEASQSMLKVIFRMLKNLHFILVLVVYGLMAGSYFAFATTLNDMMLHYFPNCSVEIGWMGLLFIATGLVGSIFAGWLLDVTHKYKEIYMGICILTFLLYILFSALLLVDKLWVQFLITGILGLFMTSFLPVGFEFGIEVTFPESEIISAMLLNASSMGFGILITEVVSRILDTKGPIWSNASFCIVLLLCCIISSFITTEYKRLKKNKETLEK
ncbi:choline/ethanolamine transporter FLVCR2-like isoform X1 [Parasteatoda tepidariorum]|uniref:choline/ethanolamine transporter FLVCR2-like isoform X1 n=1 Tax=Parasteatoda tepidariorum TaxID=114398 RepID=UPI001C717D36|nr:feline leukemia virus subgroup C receptor-related protein 2-like isoform X1 [Parasteatoda tepidariorum]